MPREIGAPFESRRVERAAGARRSPDYLRLNPHGRALVLVQGGTVLYETVADRAPPRRAASKSRADAPAG